MSLLTGMHYIILEKTEEYLGIEFGLSPVGMFYIDNMDKVYILD